MVHSGGFMLPLSCTKIHPSSTREPERCSPCTIRTVWLQIIVNSYMNKSTNTTRGLCKFFYPISNICLHNQMKLSNKAFNNWIFMFCLINYSINVKRWVEFTELILMYISSLNRRKSKFFYLWNLSLAVMSRSLCIFRLIIDSIDR